MRYTHNQRFSEKRVGAIGLFLIALGVFLLTFTATARYMGIVRQGLNKHIEIRGLSK